MQAAIAAVHDEAADAEDTDWPQILALYELLERIAPNPMVTLNRAVAVAMVHGPRAGLELLDSSRPTTAWRRTTASTPSAPTCWRWPAITPPPGLPTSGGPPHTQPSRAPAPPPPRVPVVLAASRAEHLYLTSSAALDRPSVGLDATTPADPARMEIYGAVVKT